MKITRLVLVALVCSLAACAETITGPSPASEPAEASANSGYLGSGG